PTVTYITEGSGGDDPGVVAWRIRTLEPEVSTEDFGNRVVLRWDNSGTTVTSTSTTTAGWYTYGGATLHVGRFARSSASSSGAALAERNELAAKHRQLGQILTVTVDDPAAVTQLTDPGALLGSAVGLHLPSIGMYDPAATPVPYRGGLLWP